MIKVGKTDYTTFDDLWNDKSLLTPSEKGEIDFIVGLIGKFIEAREAKGLTQKELAESAGIKQSAVARLERMQAIPQIDTLFKLLLPLGYTLEIAPLKTATNKG